MIDPMMQAEAMMWAWCSIFHRKHHTKSDNPITCTTYRECGKCGSYVVSRNRKLERARDTRLFEQERDMVRAVYAPVGDWLAKKQNQIAQLDEIAAHIPCRICGVDSSVHGCKPSANACMNTREWPDTIE